MLPADDRADLPSLPISDAMAFRLYLYDCRRSLRWLLGDDEVRYEQLVAPWRRRLNQSEDTAARIDFCQRAMSRAIANGKPRVVPIIGAAMADLLDATPLPIPPEEPET
ncbi:MAG: hypothetical protein V4636_12975 [Pseudomonadota bacterium]